MNYIHGEDRNQMRIESLESFASPDSEVRVIDKIVDAMDIESLGFKLGNNKDSGRPKFDPKDLLKLYIYGYFNGIRSSRKLAKQCVINKEVIWLIKDIKPKYRVIADFRKDNIDALESIFKSFVNYCINLGLYSRELVALDGTKLEASASKRKHYSRNKLIKMREIANSKIKEYLHEIEVSDRLENQKELDKELINIEIDNLKEKLKYYDELEKNMDEADVNEINLTDNDARTVKFGAHQGTDVGYNVQAVVDCKNKLITTFEVNNLSQDQGQLYTMSKKAKDIYKVKTLEVLADKGYFDSNDIHQCEREEIITYVSKPCYSNGIGDSRYFSEKFKYDNKTDTYICPEGNRLYLITRKKDSKIKEYNNSEVCNRCSNKSKCTKAKNGKVIRRNESSQSVENMILRLETCKDKYSLRKSIVEHPFGTLKRNMNFTYLLLRNFKNVRGEISIAFFTYNLKRVIKILGVKGILESLYTVILLTIFNNVNLYRKVYA